jgi:NADPH:quinone reductase-like Zn-dependent oxidoreductase
MRAVVHDRYGPPEVLRVAEVERPVPKENEVLVRVHASTVTRGDAMGVRSVEYRFSRLFTGIRRPRRTIFGSEFAGRVEEVGSAVTEFRVGDEVFGIKGGATAEYVAVRESGVIALKPTGLTSRRRRPSPTDRCSR